MCENEGNAAVGHLEAVEILFYILVELVEFFIDVCA